MLAPADVDDRGRPQRKRYLSGVCADGSAITRMIDGGHNRGSALLTVHRTG